MNKPFRLAAGIALVVCGALVALGSWAVVWLDSCNGLGPVAEFRFVSAGSAITVASENLGRVADYDHYGCGPEYDTRELHVHGAVSTEGKRLFIGIAPPSQLERYLGEHRRDLGRLDFDPEDYTLDWWLGHVTYKPSGSKTAGLGSPDALGFWSERAQTGEDGLALTYRWKPPADYRLVFMNEDGSPGIRVVSTITVELSGPRPVPSYGASMIGLCFMLAGVVLAWSASRPLG